MSGTGRDGRPRGLDENVPSLGQRQVVAELGPMAQSAKVLARVASVVQLSGPRLVAAVATGRAQADVARTGLGPLGLPGTTTKEKPCNFYKSKSILLHTHIHVHT